MLSYNGQHWVIAFADNATHTVDWEDLEKVSGRPHRVQTGVSSSLQVMADHPSNVAAGGDLPTKPFERYNGNLDGDIQTAKAASKPPTKKRKKAKAKDTQKEEGVSPQSCSNVPDDVLAEAWTLRRLWKRGSRACCMAEGCKQRIGKGVHRPHAACLQSLASVNALKVYPVAGAWRVHCQSTNDVKQGEDIVRVSNYNFSFCCKPSCYKNVNLRAKRVWQEVATEDNKPMNYAPRSMQLVLQPGGYQACVRHRQLVLTIVVALQVRTRRPILKPRAGSRRILRARSSHGSRVQGTNTLACTSEHGGGALSLPCPSGGQSEGALA